MNEFQRRLVDKSIEGVMPKADQVATLFFSRLSQTSPRFRYHFSADILRQRQQFIRALSMAAAAAAHPETLKADMEAIAERHVKHGLSSKDLDAALAAVMCALDHFLGGEFKPEVKQAWLSLYGELIEFAWPRLHEDNLATHMLIFEIRPCWFIGSMWKSARARWNVLGRQIRSRLA
jgi:hemoglobin-like flavoprotein